MKWITWAGVGIDRMACAWLIQRYLDPGAEFLFIAEGTTSASGDWEPFDIPGVRLSHHHGQCSFQAFLAEYGLRDPILARIGRIIDEADTIQEVEIEPAACGVDLLCRGLRRISPDDHVALERGVLVFDALYAQLEAEG